MEWNYHQSQVELDVKPFCIASLRLRGSDYFIKKIRPSIFLSESACLLPACLPTSLRSYFILNWFRFKHFIQINFSENTTRCLSVRSRWLYAVRQTTGGWVVVVALLRY